MSKKFWTRPIINTHMTESGIRALQHFRKFTPSRQKLNFDSLFSHSGNDNTKHWLEIILFLPAKFWSNKNVSTLAFIRLTQIDWKWGESMVKPTRKSSAIGKNSSLIKTPLTTDIGRSKRRPNTLLPLIRGKMCERARRRGYTWWSPSTYCLSEGTRQLQGLINDSCFLSPDGGKHSAVCCYSNIWIIETSPSRPHSFGFHSPVSIDWLCCLSKPCLSCIFLSVLLRSVRGGLPHILIMLVLRECVPLRLMEKAVGERTSRSRCISMQTLDSSPCLHTVPSFGNFAPGRFVKSCPKQILRDWILTSFQLDKCPLLLLFKGLLLDTL